MNTNAEQLLPPATISQKDVAAEAGVSQSTVHRVFAGHPTVSGPASARVRKAAARLGYVPNLHARRLRLGTHENIAIVMGLTASILPEKRVIGICDYLQDTRYGVSLVRLPDEALSDPEYMSSVRQRVSFDGMLMNYTHEIPTGLLDSVRLMSVPTVWMNIDWPMDCVYIDEQAVTADLVKYLYELGHRSIAGLNLAARHHYGVRSAIRGYRDAVSRLGIEVNLVDQVVPRADRPAFLRRWLAETQPPTAVVALSPSMAYPLIRTAMERGLRIPRDMSVVCLSQGDDFDLGGWQLTHMLHSEKEIGECAARMLMQKISKGDELLPSIGLRCRLVEGETTCPPGR